MKIIDYFEHVEVILNKDIEVDDTFNPLDKDLFEKTGDWMEVEFGGETEICRIKQGSRVFVMMTPNGLIDLFDSEKAMSYGHINRKDFTLPKGVDFWKPAIQVKGKPGLFKR